MKSGIPKKLLKHPSTEKMLNKRLTFSGLLLLTFAFFLITLFTQWYLIVDINPFIDKSQNTNNAKEKMLNRFLNKHKMNSSDCEYLISNGLELNDLNRMKYSYLNELKKLEIKRKNQLKQIGQLQLKITTFKSELDKLKMRREFLNLKILKDSIKLKDLETESNKQVSLIKSISLMAGDSIPDLVRPVRLAARTQFNYEKCPFNTEAKLSVHIFEFDTVVSHFNLNELNKSVDLVRHDRLSQACLVIVFLIEKTNILYYRSLAQLIREKKNENFIFIHSATQQSFESLHELNELVATFNDQTNLINTKRALFASFQMNEANMLRTNLIHFSVLLDLDYAWFKSENQISKNRKYLLSFHRSTHFTDQLTFEVLKKYLSNMPNHIQLDLDCLKDKYNLCFDSRTRLFNLQNSRFTLLVQADSGQLWSIENTYRLIEALQVGTIPVLIDMNLKLPLEHLIAWNEIVIRIPLARLNQLFPILIRLQHNELNNRQLKARNVFNAYFSTPTHLFKTLLASVQFDFNLNISPLQTTVSNEIKHFNSSITNIRNSESFVSYMDDEADEESSEFLGEINQKPLDSLHYNNNLAPNSYIMWNKYYYPFNSFSSTPFDSNNLFVYDSYDLDMRAYGDLVNYTMGGFDGRYFHHMLSSNYPEEQFTIIILAYKREKNLLNLVEKYVRLPYLHSIIVVWNSLDTELSKEFQAKFSLYLSSKRLRLIRSSRNSLNNRFLPYDLIKTDAVLSLDDDTALRADEILFAFRVWRSNREQIVGFPARFHAWSFKQKNYVYRSQLSCEYSMVLTGAAFYHRFYHFYFTHVMNPAIRMKIDELNNCEDIAFNMMVSHLTRKPPIKVTTKWSFYCSDCDNNEDSQISMLKDHYEERTICMQYFISAKLTDNSQKCFKLI